MEILERYDDNSVIALVDITKLHDHEEIKQDYLKELTKEIKKDKELRCPLIVDKYSHVVLDGHHRFCALKNLGCKTAPSHIVDYYNPSIKVESWHPVIKSKREVKAIFKSLGNSGFTIDKVANERILKVLVEAEQACIGMITKNEKEDYFIAKGEAKTYKDAMECIEKGLKTEGFRKELDYVGDEKEVEVILKSKKASMIIYVPKVTKDEVIQTGTSGKPFPAKTTRHILPERKQYPVPLSNLMKPPKEE